ncbi:regulatory protein RecX [Desulfobacula toluolica]|uniref:Regulatory protein RecX n=1 Tax=Desulfobacula toluolica (strain DSM 7467 / Tol2) TaxID=651182 RepID=K0NQB5_DESTT|nr:regulatory protein RecX [Desulfobacula toluolica]CCK81072.1 RecX: regulatory protein [Desulfobacula toluolica Tol2]
MKIMDSFSNNTKKIGPPLNMAIKYLAYQPRTVYEIQEYLKKKGISEDFIKKIIEILLEKKYLDDRYFAKFFIETKAKHKPKSKFAFRYELKKKGINPSIIDAVLTHYDDQDLALKSVRPKIKTWHRLDNKTFKKKMMNFLRYRGFNYDICLATLTHFIESRD